MKIGSNATVMLALAGAAVLGACSETRPLTSIRESAHYYDKVGQYDKALPEYRAFLANKPEDTELRYEYASALLKNGQYAEARDQFLLLTDITPTDERFADGYARSLFETGNNAEVTAYLNRMTVQRGSVGDWLRMGDYCQKTGDVDGAKAAYRKAAKIDGGRSVKPWVAMADMFAGLNDKANERAMVERALYIEPMSPTLSERYKKLGGMPGPTAGVRPEEWVAPKTK